MPAHDFKPAWQALLRTAERQRKLTRRVARRVIATAAKTKPDEVEATASLSPTCETMPFIFEVDAVSIANSTEG